ncbi:MAG: hypothetical protein EOO31_01360 [Comamonadaceae bacterium]|nr:MAG: hypothetical protein EOO31_01360 [Comamonadaceae bacterium]
MTYGYNAAERLIRYARTTAGQGTPEVEVHYRYDPFGRRIAKAVQEGQKVKITYFFYRDTGLLGETNAQGQMTTAYAFHPHKAQQGLWSTDPIWQRT